MSSLKALFALTLPWLGLGAALGGCAPAERPRTVTVVEVIPPGESEPALADPFTPLSTEPFSPLSTEPFSPLSTEPPRAAAHQQPREATWFDVEASPPARQVIETAEQMLTSSVIVRGSCYTYIDAIYERAGFGDRRSRQVVFHGQRSGPYADLDLLRPGDWLFIVTSGDSRPIRTHSVLFLGWENRARSDARVVSYVGGQAERPAHLMARDISRTYAIQRPGESG